MEDNSKIQQMQFIEQNLQAILMQKQAFQMEFNENVVALKEVEKSGEEVYKIVGQLMIKSDKTKVLEDLKNKEKLIDTRIKSLETQEESLQKQSRTLREEILEAQKEKK